MYYILYNPLSNGGTCESKAIELENKFKKEEKPHKKINLLEVDNLPKFLDTIPNEDNIIIVGGDGTLYHLTNQIQGYDISNKIILLAKAGTGNDFYRDIKHEEKDGFVIRVELNDMCEMYEKGGE